MRNYEESLPTISSPSLAAIPDQFLTVIFGHIPGAVRYGSRVCNLDVSRDEFEDICQEVIIFLIENNYYRLRNYQGRSSVKTWLYIVVRRYIQNRFGANMRQSSLEDIGPDHLKYSPAQENTILYRERKEAIDKVLSTLPNRLKQLYEFTAQGFSDVEISQVSGITADAVRKQRYTLIKKLRRYFESIGY